MEQEKLKLLKRDFFKNMNLIKNKGNWSGCFHGGENCGGIIIKAHTIQLNGILDKLAEKGRVYMFRPNSESNMYSNLKLIGKGQATTFRGFCKKHDQEIFENIDKSDYELENKEQEFLFVYRALAKAYHSKKTTYQMNKNLVKNYNQFDPSQLKGVRDFLNPTQQVQLKNFNLDLAQALMLGSERILKPLEKFREVMNSNLSDKNFNEIETLTLTFDEEFHLATSDLIIMEKDLLGKTINNGSNLFPLFLTIFPQNGKTFVLLSCFEQDKDHYKELYKKLSSTTVMEQKEILSNILITYTFNLVLSPRVWEKFDLNKKHEISELYQDCTESKGPSLIKKSDFNLFISHT